MAMTGRLRNTLPFLRSLVVSESVLSTRRPVPGASANPSTAFSGAFRKFSNDSNWKEAYVPVITSMVSGTYGTEKGWEKPKVKVPLTMFGGMGNYATALFISASEAKKLDKVESELLEVVEKSKKDPDISEFLKDLSIPRKARVKYVQDLCAKSGYTDITKNFFSVLAEYGRLRYVEKISNRFLELTMAHKGEVKVIVTTVLPLPPEEDTLLKETLKEILPGKTAIIEQKIDPSILGGIMVEFDQKLFDASIKTRAQKMEKFLREPGNFESFVNANKM